MKLSATARMAWKNAIKMEREYMSENKGHYLVDKSGQAYVKRPGVGKARNGRPIMYSHFLRTEFFHRELERLKAEERSKMKD